MLKTYIARASPIHLFVKQYSRLVADREEEEGREEHATKQVPLALPSFNLLLNLVFLVVLVKIKYIELVGQCCFALRAAPGSTCWEGLHEENI
jgi:hypothetical protein